ncbi:MAG: hypothetical protein IKO19_10790 [Candidatus Riflebacteria bacterium]|nr:hypothetical protein [Candidatus Riflebacteria bacterium]
MVELYGIVANTDNAEIITMLSIILLCVAYVAHIWKLAGLTGRRFDTWEWIQVYFFGTIIFLCSVCSFAKLVLPDNADQLLKLLYLDDILKYITVRYQTLLLKIIRAMI